LQRSVRSPLQRCWRCRLCSPREPPLQTAHLSTTSPCFFLPIESFTLPCSSTSSVRAAAMSDTFSSLSLAPPPCAPPAALSTPSTALAVRARGGAHLHELADLALGRAELELKVQVDEREALADLLLAHLGEARVP
jgi:hypothetical protein